MTDDPQRSLQRPEMEAPDDGMDVPLDPDRPEGSDGPATKKPEEPNPLLREGADSLDAADIEDPERQL